MSVYYTNEAAFDLIEGEGEGEGTYADRSVTVLVREAPSGGAVTLTIERHPMPVGKSLRELVKAHVGQTTLMKRGVAVLFEREREAGGAPAIEVGLRSRGDDGMMFTHEAHVAAGGTRLLFAANAAFADRDAASAQVEHALDSLRLRE